MAESLRLGLRLDAPAQARRWIRDICSAHGLDGLIDDATLLVSELVTNAVLHARTPCRVRAEVGERTLRIHVMDEDPTVIQPIAPRGGAERGHGLAMVAALSTDWGMTQHHAGKSVWFTLAETDRAAAPTIMKGAYAVGTGNGGHRVEAPGQ